MKDALTAELSTADLLAQLYLGGINYQAVLFQIIHPSLLGITAILNQHATEPIGIGLIMLQQSRTRLQPISAI